MHQYDVWLDLQCEVNSSLQAVCTLFAKMTFPVRPMVGESLTFWSAKDSNMQFSIVSVVGVMLVHYASTEIDNIAHHVSPVESGSEMRTSIRCVPIHVASMNDAKVLVALLTEQYGFELDPYGVNKLAVAQSAA